MPIFKRYYIADIPGLGWLAQFYVTHLIHYAAGGILIGLVFYFLVESIFDRKTFGQVTRIGWLGFVLIIGLALSGILLVIKNLSGVYFNHILIIGLDLIHLVMCMGLLTITAYTFVAKKEWMRNG